MLRRDGYEPFRELIVELRAAGCAPAAQALQAALGVSSVGSEVLGALGQVLLAHRADFAVNSRVTHLADQCILLVQRAWPKYQ